jgi:hypothetical protein
MKKLFGLICVMLLIFVVSGPVGATGNGGVFPGGGHTQGVFPGGGQTQGVFPGGGQTEGVSPSGGQTEGVSPSGGQTEGVSPSGGNGAHASEPATLVLLGCGLVSLAVYGRKRFQK